MKIEIIFVISIMIWCKIECEGGEENPYSFHLFENMEGSIKTFMTELKLLKILKDYQTKLVQIKKHLKSSLTFLNSTYSETPIQSFQFLINNFNLKLFCHDNFEKLRQFGENITNQWQYRLNTTQKDYAGALNGILLLQDTYDFQVNKAVRLDPSYDIRWTVE